MRNVLNEPRVIVIAGRSETFRSHTDLVRRGDTITEMMQKIETNLDSSAPDAAADWSRLASLAHLLAEVLAAQRQWLADHDAHLDGQAEELRTAIRKLNLSSGITDVEAGS